MLYEEIDNLDITDCCKNSDIGISSDGLNVCKNCGLTFGQSYKSQERRAYTQLEIAQRRRTEQRWRSYGPRTIISVVKTDAKGKKLNGKSANLFKRLSKIQSSLVNSIERNYWEAKPKLNSFCSLLTIPDYIRETAWSIYSEVAKQKLTMGRSIEAFVCASLYASIRIHEFPRLLEEVCDIVHVVQKIIHKSLGLIVRLVLPILHLKYKPIMLLKVLDHSYTQLSGLSILNLLYVIQFLLSAAL